jgi:CHASE3 domain sensor protein
MNFDPTLVILVVIFVVIFWSTIKLAKNALNSITSKTLTAVDATVTTNALEYHTELSARMRKAAQALEESGGKVDYQAEYDRLIGKL